MEKIVYLNQTLPKDVDPLSEFINPVGVILFVALILFIIILVISWGFKNKQTPEQFKGE